ncbi:hypothetical protein V495_00173 [Pseudogymnoascus sp. VKM F-4514 (FW-929)]|nr:hypothetical protein V495_00173 [Pseudogymnoascus sp. VKM F-4514 (FW-929)]KFY66831.1 hypothetical protein V497_00674 [Pseudogymnoascus sp. VKM F-4516 (FW-969)]
MKIVNTLLAFSIVALAASQEAPAMCMTSPISTLAAGDVTQASVWNPIGRSCQATLSFADDNFLPVHFDTRPNTCLGAQLMELTIPNEIPNGEAFLSWRCAGDVASLCSLVMLVGGQSDVGRLALAQTASLVCEVLPTTLATLTTSSTLGTTSTSPTASGSSTKQTHGGWDATTTSPTERGSSTSPTPSGSATAGSPSGASGASGAATTNSASSATSQTASADAITVTPLATPTPTPTPVDLCPCNEEDVGA